MTKVRLKYLHCFRDRHGKARYYFRYRDQQWPIPTPGTGGFATAYDSLLAHIGTNPLTCRHNVEKARLVTSATPEAVTVSEPKQRIAASAL
jgi:hypothetical protein